MAKGRRLIESIHIKGFKSLRDVHLRLGAMNLFVGVNASGKSNFFDGLRLLQGLAHGFTINEVLDGKPRTATREEWEAIRGGSVNASFRGGDTEPVSVEAYFTLPKRRGRYRYAIAFHPLRGQVESETLASPDGPLYEARVAFGGASLAVNGQHASRFDTEFERSKPVLHQLMHSASCPEEWIPLLREVVHALSDIQRVDPSPDTLREYSHGAEPRRMGEHGESFAALIDSILKDRVASEAYTTWLKQLTPSELDYIEILRGAINEPLFALRKNGYSFPAPVLSDGTLRFAAIAAALFQPDLPRVLLIEEIEKGLHPTRLQLLLELLKSQAKPDGPQVMATTHSPLVLSWLDLADYSSVFFCAKDPATGESIFTPFSRLPHLADAVRTQPLGDLFAEGWLETVL